MDAAAWRRPITGTIEAAEIVEEIEGTISDLGFRLVDIQIARSAGRNRVSIVIHKSGGISIDDCALVSRRVLPVTEVHLNDPDPYIEVMSPGLGRKLRSHREFRAFVDEEVDVRLASGDEFRGRIVDLDDEVLRLLRDEGPGVYPWKDIASARLADR